MTVIKDTELENYAEDLRKQIRSMASRQDIDGLARLPREQLELRRAEAAERVETRQNRLLDENRNATDREHQLSKADLSEIEALDAALLVAERNARHGENMAALADLTDTNQVEKRKRRGGHSPLLVSEEHLRSHAEAIRHGGTFGAVEEIFTRATVTVATDTGSPGSYGEGGIPEPNTLRQFARIPVMELEGATAQMPSLTLPTGVAGVNESTAHAEYDTLDVANLTALRYGRWSNVTSFVDEFTTLKAINQAHAVGIARDLNLVDLTGIQTAAGSVTAFDASNLDRNVRQAILKVSAAAMVPPEDVVLFGTSAALGVVTGYAPASGDDRGSVTTRVFGARCYVTEQSVAGNVYAFAPAGFQIFATRLRSASVIEPSNGQHKFGSWLHSTAPGVFIVGSAAGVDVVTP